MRQYHQLLERILAEGVRKGDRTGTGTLSVFGHQMRFRLEDGFPLVVAANVVILPGIPELLRAKFESIRGRFAGEPFRVARIFLNALEGDVAASLGSVQQEFPDVEIGSYPTLTEPDYKIKITVESKTAELVERCMARLLEKLDPFIVIRTET